MKRIHIFKTGKHTSAGGSSIEFSEDVLRRAAEAYDPAIHEAPIVVGHPADNGPAYGWVSKLEYDEGNVFANPQNIEDQFSELVKAGRFKKVSASFYSPDAPTNPVPGSYYLRHVGFLGATPPAIKGLQPIEFGEAPEGIVEFGEMELNTTTSIFTNLREWLIDRFSRDEANTVIPEWALDDLELAKQMNREAETADEPFTNGFTEKTQKETDMELQAQLDAALAENATLKTQATNFTERETALQARESELDKAKIKADIQSFADAGRILPAEVNEMVEFASGLDAEKTVEFSEGVKATHREHFIAMLAKRPVAVDFSEHSRESAEPLKAETPNATAERITAYREKKESEGSSVTFDQALRAVKAGTDK